MVLDDDFREIWNCTYWLKKLVWIQPEIKKRAQNYRSVDISIWEGYKSQKFKILKETTWKGRRHFGVLSLTQQRSDSIRFVALAHSILLFHFLSFPQSSIKTKSKVSSKFTPFLYRISAPLNNSSFPCFWLSFPPCHAFFLGSLIISSRLTTLSTNQKKKKWKKQVSFFFLHLGLLLFLWFLFCLLYKFSWILKWVLLFYLESSSVSKGENQGTRRSRGFQGTFFASIEWWFFFSRYFFLFFSFLLLFFSLLYIINLI